jgi:hypothetical protein
MQKIVVMMLVGVLVFSVVSFAWNPFERYGKQKVEEAERLVETGRVLWNVIEKLVDSILGDVSVYEEESPNDVGLGKHDQWAPV